MISDDTPDGAPGPFPGPSPEHAPNESLNTSSVPSHSVGLLIHEVVKHKKKVHKPSTHDYSRLLSMMYAVVLVVLGLLFPLTEALRGEWNSSLYNMIFQLVIFTVGIVFIVYVQFVLIPRSENKRSKPSKFNCCKKSSDQSTVSSNGGSPNGTEMMNFNDRSRESPGSNESLDSYDSEGGEIYKDVSSFGSAFSHEGSSLYLRFGALIFTIGNIIYIGLLIENGSQATYDPKCNFHEYWWISIFRLVFLIAQSFLIFKNIHVQIDSNQPLARFGFMHLIATNMCVWLQTIINEILNEYLELNEVRAANRTSHGAAPALNGQLHNAEPSLAHQPHDSSSSLAEKIISLAVNAANFTTHHHWNANHTTTHGGLPHEVEEEDDCDVYRGYILLASPYLFPFVLEYSLIAMGTVTIMYTSIVHNPSNGIMHSVHNWVSVEALDETLPSASSHATGKHNQHSHHGKKHRKHHSRSTILAKSHRGLFTGVLVLSGTIVSVFTFYFIAKQQEIIYLVTDLCLHLALLVATIIALYCLNKMAYIAKPLSVDDVLLIVGACGAFVFEVAIIMSSIGYVRTNSDNHDLEYSIEVLSLTAALVAFIQTFLQVLLILSGMRRYPNKVELVKEMPGRGTITFLLIVNVAVWFERSLHSKVVSHNTEDKFYGLLAAILQTNINLPLLLFFRFHSSICCADIWNVAYTPMLADNSCVTSEFRGKDGRSVRMTARTDHPLQQNNAEPVEAIPESPRAFRKKIHRLSRSGPHELGLQDRIGEAV